MTTLEYAFKKAGINIQIMIAELKRKQHESKDAKETKKLEQMELQVA